MNTTMRNTSRTAVLVLAPFSSYERLHECALSLGFNDQPHAREYRPEPELCLFWVEAAWQFGLWFAVPR